MTVFLTIVLSIWAAMHIYVFSRLATVPWATSHIPRLGLGLIALGLWLSYPLVRVLDSRGFKALAAPLEFVAANWLGILFLSFSTLLIADVVTLGGWVLPRLAPALRGWAVMLAGTLSVLALIQGLRPPVLREYQVQLTGLPPERDGLVLVQVSDLHLGSMLGKRWMTRLIGRVHGLRPDLIVVVGDLVDGNVGRVEPLRPLLKSLRAPLGVWAVTGNHEYYAGVEPSVRLLEDCGYSVLRDRAARVAPGLVLAGVDDLTAREQFGMGDQAVERALAHRPPGATILLSHSPMDAEKAAAAGAGLMLSGHTHNGQIWPFTYFVGLKYSLLGGRYDVDGMPVIVCRGTGTWGPRMRLWRPSEIVKITLRAKRS